MTLIVGVHMKINKKIILLISCVSLFLCLFIVKQTYAKYINTAQGNTNITIARWRILVNNEDIRNNPEITGSITPVITTNEHIKPGVMAPTSEGYFDIVIDSTDVDVSFQYTITPTIPETACVKDLNVTGYSLNNGTVTPVISNAPITNTILYMDNITTTNLRIYIKWIDDETQIMDNSADTQTTINTACTANINVALNFIQLQN